MLYLIGIPSALATAKIGTWSSSVSMADQPGESKSSFGSEDRSRVDDGPWRWIERGPRTDENDRADPMVIAKNMAQDTIARMLKAEALMVVVVMFMFNIIHDAAMTLQ